MKARPVDAQKLIELGARFVACLDEAGTGQLLRERTELFHKKLDEDSNYEGWRKGAIAELRSMGTRCDDNWGSLWSTSRCYWGRFYYHYHDFPRLADSLLIEMEPFFYPGGYLDECFNPRVQLSGWHDEIWGILQDFRLGHVWGCYILNECRLYFGNRLPSQYRNDLLTSIDKSLPTFSEVMQQAATDLYLRLENPASIPPPPSIANSVSAMQPQSVQGPRTENTPLPDSPASTLEPDFHSDDYTFVRWSGEEFTFTIAQAACVQVLWEAKLKGLRAMRQAEILEKAGYRSTKLSDVFKNHETWTRLIVPAGRKGMYGLRKPDASTQIPR